MAFRFLEVRTAEAPRLFYADADANAGWYTHRKSSAK